MENLFRRGDAGQPLIVGHRGAAGLAPENTLPAFKLAVRIGAGVVECDVRRSQDGEILVFHDEEMRRLTSLKGRLSDWTANDLREKARVHASAPIPTLRELCTLLRDANRDEGREVALFVEIKEPGLAGIVSKTIQEVSPELRCVLGSFLEAEVRAVIQAGAHPALQLSVSNTNYAEPLWIRPEFQIAGIPLSDAKEETISALKGQGLAVWVWTVNRIGDMQRLILHGVDGIITNRPDRLVDLLNRETG